MTLVTGAHLARITGVSKAAVSLAIKRGRLPAVLEGKLKKIDLENPQTQLIAEEMAQKGGVELNWPEILANAAIESYEPSPAGPKSAPAQFRAAPEVEEKRDLESKKKEADTRLVELKIKKATEEYLSRINVIVDYETLQKKMGAFSSTLVTHLIYLPEEVADQLWLKAQASDDPVKAIREDLSVRLASAISHAKRAAADVVPKVDERKYVVMDGTKED